MAFIDNLKIGGKKTRANQPRFAEVRLLHAAGYRFLREEQSFHRKDEILALAPEHDT